MASPKNVKGVVRKIIVYSSIVVEMEHIFFKKQKTKKNMPINIVSTSP